MYNPFKNFSDSLKNTDGGWSGRKLTAFALTLCVVAMHVAYYRYALMLGNFSLFTEVLIIDLVGIGFFLGLVTVANIIELRTGRKSESKATITEEKTVVSDLEKPEG